MQKCYVLYPSQYIQTPESEKQFFKSSNWKCHKGKASFKEKYWGLYLFHGMNILEWAEQRWLILYATRIKKQLHHHSSDSQAFGDMPCHINTDSKAATRADFFGKRKPTMTTNSDPAEIVFQNVRVKPSLSQPSLKLFDINSYLSSVWNIKLPDIANCSFAIPLPALSTHTHTLKNCFFCKIIIFLGLWLPSAQHCATLSLQQENNHVVFLCFQTSLFHTNLRIL